MSSVPEESERAAELAAANTANRRRRRRGESQAQHEPVTERHEPVADTSLIEVLPTVDEPERLETVAQSAQSAISHAREGGEQGWDVDTHADYDIFDGYDQDDDSYDMSVRSSEDQEDLVLDLTGLQVVQDGSAALQSDDASAGPVLLDTCVAGERVQPHNHAEEHDICDCGHDHHDHDTCGHDHEDAADTCTCAHDQTHEHHHDACGCGHDHEHHHHHDHGGDACGCAHEHHHDHEHDTCGCGHDHNHDHDACGCGCCCEDETWEDRLLSSTPSFSYHVLGIDCPNCALGTQNAVRALPCVADARLVYATSTLEVVKASSVSSHDCLVEVLKTVRSCGQDLELSEAELEELSARRSWFAEHREQVLMGASGATLALGLILDLLVRNEQLAIPFYVVAAVLGLIFVFPMAIAALRRRTADMNVLMAIAVLGGLAMGFTGDTEVFRDAAIVIFLDQVGEWLEGWSMRKTSGSIRELMTLAPDVAHVIDGSGVIHEIEVSEVEEGEHLRVLPGERVPLDGVILEGSSSFDESPVTGESVPQDKGPGAEIYAGSLNTSGVVDIEVTADEDCTTLARVIAMVQGAQAEKAPYEGFVERFAAAYTPIVVVGAILVGLGVPLVMTLVSGPASVDWRTWIYRALSLLVVACPCALVISTPVSFVSALTRAAKNGVLIKGGAYFDIATHIDAMCFDKTGTLTSGRPTVTRVIVFGDSKVADIIGIAAALEESSTHPLARAVRDYALAEGIRRRRATAIREVAASGMSGIVHGDTCTVGKLGFAREQASVTAEVEQAVTELANEGASALVVTRAGTVLGVIGVADTVREVAHAALSDLHDKSGVAILEMLTGDNDAAAGAIAAKTGVTAVSAELLPQDKVERIRELQGAGHVVGMVGDGINDAPALATADLGVTMGAAASDTALEVADVALLSDDLTQLPAFFALARRTMNIVRENIAFAIGVKVLVFVLVALGMAGMGAAVFADTGVALLVILNGMRLMLDSRSRW